MRILIAFLGTPAINKAGGLRKVFFSTKTMSALFYHKKVNVFDMHAFYLLCPHAVQNC